jgi:hypothetical protein
MTGMSYVDSKNQGRYVAQGFMLICVVTGNEYQERSLFLRVVLMRKELKND